MLPFDQLHSIVAVLHIKRLNVEIKVNQRESRLPVPRVEFIRMRRGNEHVARKLRICDANSWQNVSITSDKSMIVGAARDRATDK